MNRMCCPCRKKLSGFKIDQFIPNIHNGYFGPKLSAQSFHDKTDNDFNFDLRENFSWSESSLKNSIIDSNKSQLKDIQNVEEKKHSSLNSLIEESRVLSEKNDFVFQYNPSNHLSLPSPPSKEISDYLEKFIRKNGDKNVFNKIIEKLIKTKIKLQSKKNSQQNQDDSAKLNLVTQLDKIKMRSWSNLRSYSLDKTPFDSLLINGKSKESGIRNYNVVHNILKNITSDKFIKLYNKSSLSKEKILLIILDEINKIIEVFVNSTEKINEIIRFREISKNLNSILNILINQIKDPLLKNPTTKDNFRFVDENLNFNNYYKLKEILLFVRRKMVIKESNHKIKLDSKRNSIFSNINWKKIPEILKEKSALRDKIKILTNAINNTKKINLKLTIENLNLKQKNNSIKKSNKVDSISIRTLSIDQSINSINFTNEKSQSSKLLKLYDSQKNINQMMVLENELEYERQLVSVLRKESIDLNKNSIPFSNCIKLLLFLKNVIKNIPKENSISNIRNEMTKYVKLFCGEIVQEIGEIFDEFTDVSSQFNDLKSVVGNYKSFFISIKNLIDTKVMESYSNLQVF